MSLPRPTLISVPADRETLAESPCRISQALRAKLEEAGWEDDLRDLAKGELPNIWGCKAQLTRRRACASSRNPEPPSPLEGDSTHCEWSVGPKVSLELIAIPVRYDPKESPGRCPTRDTGCSGADRRTGLSLLAM